MTNFEEQALHLTKQRLTANRSSGILAPSGRVRRGGALRTPSESRDSSGKQVSPGAVGVPARILFLPNQFEKITS